MNTKYFISLLIGSFWSFFILLRQIILIFQHRSKYFCNNKFVSFPKSLYSAKYQHKFAPLANGITLHYVSCGNPTAPLMLLVHGFPEFWYSWRHQMDHFKDKYHVVAVDMRGYGLSDKPQSVSQYKITLLVDDLFHLLKHLEASKCVLVGHDWGGAITWRFTQRYPHMVERFVAMNFPHPVAFLNQLRSSWRQFLKSWYMFFFQLPCLPEWSMSRLGYQLIVDSYTRRPMGMRLNKLTEEEEEAYRANFMIPGVPTASLNYYRAAMRFNEEVVTADAPDNVYPRGVPCLLIWGEEDGALSKEMALNSSLYCPQLLLQFVPGSSHWVQQDAPDLVNATMDKFLRK